jgi:hypothetical protein
MMRIEIIVWLIANTLSFLISSNDLKITLKVWLWARSNIRGGMYNVAKRNLRSSLLKFLLSLLFLLAGFLATLPHTFYIRSFWVWFLILGALTLSLEVILEAKYRSNLFRQAQEKVKNEKLTNLMKRPTEND